MPIPKLLILFCRILQHPAYKDSPAFGTEEYHIRLTDSSVPTKVLPIDYSFFIFFLLFSRLFLLAIMLVAATISNSSLRLVV